MHTPDLTITPSFFYVTVITIGLITRLQIPNIQGNMELLQFTSYNLSVGFLGLMLCSLLAIIMSTADSYLNTISVIISRDIISKIFPQKFNELKVARYASFFIGVCVIPIALKNYRIIDIVFFTSNFYHPIILIPLLVGFMGIKFRPAAFYISIIVATIFTLGGAYIDQKFSVFSTATGLLGSLMCFLIISITKIIKNISYRYNSFTNTNVITDDFLSLIAFPLLYVPMLIFYIQSGTLVYVAIILNIAASILLFLHEYWLKFKAKLFFYKILLIISNLGIICILANHFYASKYIFSVFVVACTYMLAVVKIIPQHLRLFPIIFLVSLFISNSFSQTIELNKAYDGYFISYLIVLNLGLTITKLFCLTQRVSFYKEYISKLEEKYKNQNIFPEYLEAKIHSEEKYFKTMERYKKLVKLKDQLSVNKWNELNEHFVKDLESISNEEIIKDIKSFIGISTNKKKIDLLFSITKKLFSFPIESIFLYQLYFSIIVAVVDIAKSNSKVTLLIEEKQGKFYLEIKYESYVYSEAEILNYFGNKKFINPYILNLSDIIVLLGAQGLIYKITEVSGVGIFSILQDHTVKDNIIEFRKNK